MSAALMSFISRSFSDTSFAFFRALTDHPMAGSPLAWSAAARFLPLGVTVNTFR
jgi:hypothetical protein